MQSKNILDELKVIAVNGNKFYRKKDNLCIVLGAGCKYYIRSIGENKVSIDSSKQLEASYLVEQKHTSKYFKYEANIKDIVEYKRYHIDKLQSVRDGFGVSPTEDGLFKDFVTECMSIVLPAIKEMLNISDLEYIGEIAEIEYGGKNQMSTSIFLDRLLEFKSQQMGEIILEINLEMQNIRYKNEIDREIVYISRIFGEYTPTSSEKGKAHIYNIENKKARCIWLYASEKERVTPSEYKGLPIVTKELTEKETKRTLDQMQIVSVYMTNYKELSKKYKYTKKFIEFLLEPSKCLMSKDKEKKKLAEGFKNTVQRREVLSLSSMEVMYENEMLKHEKEQAEKEKERAEKEKERVEKEKEQAEKEKERVKQENEILKQKNQEALANETRARANEAKAKAEINRLKEKLKEYEL
ncbi:hypothetical protein AN639_04915 [Candidatus Epulonipiscium fishelsonii]|uniref:Uncharacterized protein n=1 Tax=Candidatus Epulonipiscium fishelsonii TaxID=77094 RepID=A0ACC8XD08_9FIRM|nr:hypothetical protein AN639_04915 [Epulopiscium sp. SCG-B05WGA-EpuloA1]ONI40821.1 hypothetical protein AN396_05220 [Epulopiscium sp. SCG-B11WGA-EpuloA1]